MVWTEENTLNVPSVFSQCYGKKGSTQVGGEDVWSRSEKQEAGSKGGGPSLHKLNI